MELVKGTFQQLLRWTTLEESSLLILQESIKSLKPFCNVQWRKGIYKRNWVPWRGLSSTQIPKESVIYFDIQFHENYKLTKEAARYLRKRYRELARE